jgi:hypothetical protein
MQNLELKRVLEEFYKKVYPTESDWEVGVRVSGTLEKYAKDVARFNGLLSEDVLIKYYSYVLKELPDVATTYYIETLDALINQCNLALIGNSKLDSKEIVDEVKMILSLIGTVNISALMEKVLAIQSKPEGTRKLHR